MTKRIKRVNSLLEHEISKILIKDFNFSGAIVTLTHIDSAANLISAKAYISVLPEEKSDIVIETLNKGIYDIQQKINKMLNMRPIPKIIFVKDKQLKEAGRIEELLGQIKKQS